MSEKEYEEYTLSDEEEIDEAYENYILEHEEGGERPLEGKSESLLYEDSQDKKIEEAGITQQEMEPVKEKALTHQISKKDSEEEIVQREEKLDTEKIREIEEIEVIEEILEDEEEPALEVNQEEDIKVSLKQGATQGWQGNQEGFKKQEEFKPIPNTSFQTYVQENKKKNKRGLRGIIFGTFKLMVFLMCLPFIAILLGGIAAIVLGAIGGSLALIGGGIFIMATATFFSSVLGQTVILLAMTSSITLIASGVLGTLICYVVMKWIILGIKKYYHRHQMKNQMQEEI